MVLQHQKPAQNEKACSERDDDELIIASEDLPKELAKNFKRKPVRKLLQKNLKKEQKLLLVSTDNAQEVAGNVTASASIAGDDDEHNGRKGFKTQEK